MALFKKLKMREQKTAKERNRYDVDEYLDEKVSLFNVKRVVGYLIKAKSHLRISLVFSIFASIAGLVGPLFIKTALDEAVPNKDYRLLFLMGAYLAASII